MYQQDMHYHLYLKKLFPKTVNGSNNAVSAAGTHNNRSSFDGNFAFRKNNFVLTENINTNSVSTLPRNQLVCKIPGPFIEKIAKNKFNFD